jgi:hypothetical protein
LTTIAGANVVFNTLLYPIRLHSTPPHSHSIVLNDCNALIYVRKTFLLTVQIRPQSVKIFRF